MPLLRRPPHQGRAALVPQRRQCLVGTSELLAQPLGRSERTVTPMRRTIGPFAGRLEPGDHRDTPAQQPAKLLLRLAPQIADIAEGLGIVALFLANPSPEGGLFTSHRIAALLALCQPRHSILTSMTASREAPLMDEAPYYAEASSPVRGSGHDRRPTRSRRSNGANQRRGDPGPGAPE